MHKILPTDPATADHTRSADPVAANLDALRALFPEAVAEGRVDFDVLRQLLGDAPLPDDTSPTEKYGLHWAGKRRARQLALTPSTGTLRPARPDSLNWDTTQNLVIEGDNLEVLKLLQKSYAGKVKLIYIDPPYNTGKDFVYKDDFRDNISNYLKTTGQVDGVGNRITSNAEASGRFHTDWLNMMHPRLIVAKQLLAESGAIFVSIDDTELPNLRLLLDQVFGGENLVGVWQWHKSTTPPALSYKIKKTVEYVVGYEKVKAPTRYRGAAKTSPSNDPLTKPQNTHKTLTFPPGSISIDIKDGVIPAGIYGTDKYPNELLADMWCKSGRNVESISFHNRFVWTQENLHGELGKGTRICLSDKLVFSYKKSEYDPEVPPSLINGSVGVGTTEAAGKDLDILLGVEGVFDYPKPTALLSYLMGFMCGPSDLVLDFFAGSGTTGHAVMAQNAADGGCRRYILVQLPEPLDPEKANQRAAANYCDTLGKPRTIAELTKERLRRAAAKIAAEAKPRAAIDLLDESGADNARGPLDLGFRVFNLAPSNFRTWAADPATLTDALENSMAPILDDRTDQDILHELLLKRGLDLAAPIASRTVGKHTLHAIGGGILMICLSRSIARADAEPLALAMASWHTELAPAGDPHNHFAYFLDSAFADDVAKANLAAILHQHGIPNVNSL